MRLVRKVRWGKSLVFAAALAFGFMDAAAQAHAQDQQGIPSDAKAAAEKILRNSIGVNHAVYYAYSLVTAGNPIQFASVLFDILAGLGPNAGSSDISVRQARDEIIAELRKINETNMIARSNSLLERMAELVEDPNNMLVGDRLANYLDDASDLFNDLRLIVDNPDRDRMEIVYRMAPTYNIVASSRVAGLRLADWARASIDNVILAAFDTNNNLLRTIYTEPPAPEFYTYVVSLPWMERAWSGGSGSIICCVAEGCTRCNPISFSCARIGTLAPTSICRDQVESEALARWNSDGTVYSLKQALTEQGLALMAL